MTQNLRLTVWFINCFVFLLNLSQIINKASGRALSVNGGIQTVANGSTLVQLDYAGLASQQWRLEVVPCDKSANFALFTDDTSREYREPIHNHLNLIH